MEGTSSIVADSSNIQAICGETNTFVALAHPSPPKKPAPNVLWS